MPSEGPVILATNCDRPEKCMLVLGATDRVIRFLLLENSKAERLPWLLRQMVKPISVAVLKYKRVTPDAIDRGLKTAVGVLQRGEVVGLPTDTADGTFDFDRFLHELREAVPAAKVVPVYCGPDEPVAADGRKGRVWIAFGKPIDAQLPVAQIRDKIDALGERVAEAERTGRVTLTGEVARASIALAEDLPGHP
jgi:hypothetical protein